MLALITCFLFVHTGGVNAAEFQVIGSPQPIVAVAGDDVILPCSLEPPIFAEHMTVVWSRPDLDPKYVHVHRDGRTLVEDQNPSYLNRTFLFEGELINGNVSLKLSRVRLEDQGNYTCHIPTYSRDKEAFIQLIVAEPQVIGSPQPIVAVAGDDVILPCSLEPPISAEDRIVEWSRPDLDHVCVHVYRDGHDSINNQNPSYKNRTSLFEGELKNGNVSLKLSRVKLEDQGNYTCSIPSYSKDKKVVIQFLVVVVAGITEPKITKVGTNGAAVVLQCESEGWYPEPQLDWREGPKYREGCCRPADDTQTHKEHDGRYTVRSNVTAHKTDTNITCRVQVLKTNLKREAEIHITDDMFPAQPLSTVEIVVIGFACFAGGIIMTLAVSKVYRPFQRCIAHFKGVSPRSEVNRPLAQMSPLLAQIIYPCAPPLEMRPMRIKNQLLPVRALSLLFSCLLNFMCEISRRPRSRPNSQNMVPP